MPRGEADAGDRTDPATRTLCVWCPDWPVVVQRDETGPDDARPLVVLDASKRVLAASVEARLDGVRRGMRRREAEARCPEARVLDSDPGREARRFEEVVRALDAIAPRVAVGRPGVCSLPTRGPSRYFGGDDALAAQVEVLLAGCGLDDVRVGVADGAFAARLAARRARPGTAFVAPPGTTPAFLAPWPVTVLEAALDDWLTGPSGTGPSGGGAGDPAPPAREFIGLLVRLGLRTLGDLAALPAPAVTARFGPLGRLAHRLAHGLDAQPLVLTEPPPDLVAVEEFDPPASEVEPAVFRCRVLAERFLAQLGQHGLACTQVRLVAQTEHGEQLVRSWRHDGPLTAHVLGERMRWQLDGWLTDRARTGQTAPAGGLVLVRILPDELVRATGRQLGIWGGDQHAADRATRALVRIQGLLGREAVVTARPRGGRTPSEQVQWVAWGEEPEPHEAAGAGTAGPGVSPPRPVRRGGGRGARSEAAPPWPGGVPAPSPALLFDPPVPARLLDDAGRPVLVDGRGEPTAPPGFLHCPVLSGGGGPVGAWTGPWVHDLRWWDDQARRRRTLWQIETAGTVCLVALEREDAVIEAIYD
jgi:protein ImuB